MSRPASSAVGHRVRGLGLMAVRETPVSLVFDYLCLIFVFCLLWRDGECGRVAENHSY